MSDAEIAQLHFNACHYPRDRLCRDQSLAHDPNAKLAACGTDSIACLYAQA